jgi:hypothetical protein
MNKCRIDALGAANAPAFVFLHVPKTAGSTLRRIIQRQYPADRILIIEGPGVARQFHAFYTQDEERRRRVLCVVGHMPFGVHHFLPHGARYITMLRDPVEWTLSLRSYIERNPNLTGTHGARGLDLNGFLDFLERSAVTDMQTRLISGQIKLVNMLPPYDPLSDDALERAKHNLRANFEFVGVVERFDESLLLMKRKFGWRNIYYRRLNVSEGRAGRRDLPSATVERILACHHRDAELYNEGCRLLSRNIEAAGEAFQRDLRRFRRINTLYGTLHAVYKASGVYRMRDALRRSLEALR